LNLFILFDLQIMLAILQKFREKKSEKNGLAPFHLFGKGDAALIFYAHVHACSPSYTDEE